MIIFLFFFSIMILRMWLLLTQIVKIHIDFFQKSCPIKLILLTIFYVFIILKFCINLYLSKISEILTKFQKNT